MTFFCPCCFAEIPRAAKSCPHCGADIELWRNHPYIERLVHALGHPLAEVRLIASEALGRLGESGVAEPLAKCALAHALDVTQGMAVLRALAALRHDASWEGAVTHLIQHPSHAVATAAAGLLAHPIDQTSNRASTPSDVVFQVRTLIDDFANHVDATERILALGEGAITPLRRYLSDGAQVISQGRLLAVSMLARFRSSQARDGVRDVLHGTRLHELPVAWQDAEYQVKDTAIRLLLTRAYPEQLTDIVYAVEKERLPSAVVVAGELRLSSLAPLLVTMLEDDVLERAAGLSLKALGTQGQTAILQALPVLFDDAQSRVRTRLAVIRALLLLHQDQHAVLPSWVVSCTRKEAHPGVRAAGALLTNELNRGDMDALVHGALSDYTSLASACRERLVGQGLEFVTAALAALRRNAEPDIYGNQHPLKRSATRWLVTEVLRSSRTDARAREAVMAGMDSNLLAMGLTSMQNPTEKFLREIGRHPSLVVREAASALSKSGVEADTTFFRRWGPRIYHHLAGH